MDRHSHSSAKGNTIRDIILGGQDGLVNVLGIVLAVALATNDPKVVIIAGLAATFAESLSMGAVAYTSVKAAEQYYESMYEQEKREIAEKPDEEIREIREIYKSKGFEGTLLNKVVQHIISDKKIWLDTMMREELRLYPDEYGDPKKSAVIVFLSALIGSLVPLVPFLLVPVEAGIYASLVFSIAVLFAAGVIKARVTTGSKLRSGAELAAIGTLAALAGFAIGLALGTI